jgi:ketosteroid isomerase-like protein
MKSPDRAELLQRLFAAFMAGDREVAETLLADGFTFTSPYDDAIDKATYFERCWPNSGRLKSQEIERIAVEGDVAFVLYHCVTVDGRSFRNTEFFTFDGDRISSVDVFFGASYRDGAFVAADPG